MVAIEDLFSISHGNSLDLNKMQECAPGSDAVAFIGRSGDKNGIVAYVRGIPDQEPYEAGLITVALGGSALSSFVQWQPFYTAQNIDVLRSRTRMSLNVRLFYCLCIEANRFRYSTYGREANRTLNSLMVPPLVEVPAWVDGAINAAAASMCADIQSLDKIVRSNAGLT
jgi:hypothetical protein